MNWVTHLIVSIVRFNINVLIVHFKFTLIFNKYLSDTHLQSCQTSTMEFFMKVIISLQTKKVIISESLTNIYLMFHLLNAFKYSVTTTAAERNALKSSETLT